MAITSEQREKRKEGIFASDVARIMTGQSVRLVLEKIGELDPEITDDSLSLEMEVGNVIEDRILDAYALQRPDATLIRDSNELEYFHEQYQWFGCHPDARAVFPYQRRGVEAKAIGDYHRKEWGDGGDEVPAKILWQALGQMAVTGDPVTEIPVCFLNTAALKMLLTGKLPPIVIFQVQADQELQDYIIQRSQEIWTCIQTKELPAAETILDVELVYRRDTGAVIEATDEVFETYRELMKARALKKTASEMEDSAALLIKSYMQDASELRYKGERLATWKKDRDSEQLDGPAIKERFPRAVKRFMKTRFGARKFLPKEIKVEQESTSE